MSQQITVLYETAQSTPRADFLTALELAAKQQMYGAEYLQAILGRARAPAHSGSAPVDAHRSFPGQSRPATVERDLALYEHYVANRESLLEEPGVRR